MRRIITFILSTIGALFMFGAAHAQTVTQDTATATNLGLYGGEIRYIAVDQTSDFMYVGAYSPNGVFISDDSGATWTGVSIEEDFGEPRGVVVNEAGDLFVVANAGAFKSTDHGTTFTEMEDIGQYGGVAVYENDTLLIGRTDGAISVSQDDGATFTTTTVQSGANVLSMSAPTATTFYAVLDDNTTTTLYTSVNAGATWSAVNTAAVSARFALVGVEPSNNNHIILTAEHGDEQPWDSTDGGATWHQVDVTPYVTQMTFDSTGRIYLGVDYSDDHGLTWSSLTAATPISRVSGIVVPDPANDQTLYAGSFAALAKSADRGVTWTDSNAGITAVSVSDIAQSADKNTVWAATNAGLAKTTNFLDEAITWEFPIYYDVYPESVWVSPSDANTVVVGGMGVIVKTTDGGTTWTTATGWDTNLTPLQFVHDAANPDTMYAAGSLQDIGIKGGGVYMSTDGGSSWISHALPDSHSAQSLALASDGTLYVGIGNLEIRGTGATGIYRYKDGAWTALENAPLEEITSIVVDPSDDNILYATAANFDTYGADEDTTSGFYRSTDAGNTWTRVTAGLADGAKFRAIGVQTSTTPTTLYLSGTNKLTSAGEIYKSADNGQTWGLYYTGLRNETYNTLLFDGLVAGNSSGMYGLEAFAEVALTAKPKSVAVGTKTLLQVKLTDAATGKILRNRTVKLFRKFSENGKFKPFATIKTNAKGIAKIRVRIKKATYFKAQFTPRRTIDVEEFTKSTSDIVSVKVKK